MTDPLIGRVIDDRYVILQRVGTGAMGSVYRAHQRVVDREVAVKILHKTAASEPEYRERFGREARALGKLDHPGCVRVFDFGTYADLDAPYLVSEFAEGAQLHERFEELTATATRLAVIRDIAQAMAHAHDHGIVHRDLKPENVIVSGAEFRVKVVDFGLARIPREDEIRLTQEGDAHGTPAYMSPEQCRGDEQLSGACDVYALGCMLFELFEGRLPYLASTASAVLIKHVTDPIPPQRNEDTPPAVRELVIQMMQKNALDRPTMVEVADRLDEVLAKLQDEADEAPDEKIAEEAADGEEDPRPVFVPPHLSEVDDSITTTALDVHVPKSRAPYVVAFVALLGLVAGAGFVVTSASDAKLPPRDEAVAPTESSPVSAARTQPRSAAPAPTLPPPKAAFTEAASPDDEPPERAATGSPEPTKSEEPQPEPDPSPTAEAKPHPAPTTPEPQARDDEPQKRRRDSVKLAY